MIGLSVRLSQCLFSTMLFYDIWYTRDGKERCLLLCYCCMNEKRAAPKRNITMAIVRMHKELQSGALNRLSMLVITINWSQQNMQASCSTQRILSACSCNRFSMPVITTEHGLHSNTQPLWITTSHGAMLLNENYSWFHADAQNQNKRWWANTLCVLCL